MHKSGHIGLSLLLYSPICHYLLTSQFYFLAALGLVIVSYTATLPDLDLKIPRIKHRGYSHTLIGAIVMSIPVGILTYALYGYITAASENLGLSITHDPLIVSAFGIGMGFLGVLFHYAGDVVTPAGIPILAPLSRKYYTLDLFYAKNKYANGLFGFIGFLAISATFGYTLFVAIQSSL